MKKDEFCELIDDLLELPVGTVSGSDEIKNLENWDSLAFLGF